VKIEGEFIPETAIETMVKSLNNFFSINDFVDNVLRTRADEGRERQRRPYNF